MGAIVFWQALDTAQTAGVPATLAGLSISSASLLFNFAKEAATKLKPYQDKVKTATDNLAAAVLAKDEGAVKTRRENLQLEIRECAPYKVIVDEISEAMNSLLYAFAMFIADLILSLSLDPAVEQVVNAERTALRTTSFAFGQSYETLLHIDVISSTTILGLGIFFLCRAARKMYVVIPKISKVA